MRSEVADSYMAYAPQGEASGEERLVTDNLRLVIHLASKIASTSGRRHLDDDLVQSGMLGLLQAAGWGGRQRYDPERGRFSTWAAVHIGHFVRAALASGGSLLSSSRTRGNHALRRCAKRMGVEATRLLAPDDDRATREDVDRLLAAVRRLPPREADVVSRRFGLGGRPEETLQSIAADYGLTKQRVSQIESEALGRIPVLMMRHGGDG
jgi:RNA polymerase sigma factor (sigma-70 family)